MINKNKQLDLIIRHGGRIYLWLNSFLALIFLYLPIIILVIYSFNDSRFNTVWRGFTLKWYQSLLTGITDGTAPITDVMVWQALNNSLIVAGISTIFAVILGTMMALALERFRFLGRQLVEIIVFLPIIIPEITMGISLLVFFSLIFQLLLQLTGIHLVLGLPTVIIGHIAFNISFVSVVIRARLAELEPSLEEAASDLGANDWQTLWRITLPLIAPAILSATLLAFTLSLDEFVITFFIAGVGATTLPLYVYGMIKFAVTPAINAISTIILLFSLLLLGFSLFWQKR